MNTNQIRLRKQEYGARKGRIENPKTISEYSHITEKIFPNNKSPRVTLVAMNKMFAYKLVEDNIQGEVCYDLKRKIPFFGRMSKPNYLAPILFWAAQQEGQTLKEKCGGADFLSLREYYLTIAQTAIFTRKRFEFEESSWTMVAVDVGGIILLTEEETSLFADVKSDEEGDDEKETRIQMLKLRKRIVVPKKEEDQKEGRNENEDNDNKEEDDDKKEEEKGEKEEEEEEGKKEEDEDEEDEDSETDEDEKAYFQNYYSGHNFAHYITTKKPHDSSNKRWEVDKNPAYQMVVRTELMEDGFNPIVLFSESEVDALRGDEPIEINSALTDGYVRTLKNFMKSELGNVRTNITGYRDDDYIVEKIVERSTNELKEVLQPAFEGDNLPFEKCYSFMLDVLMMTKEVSRKTGACRFWYMPHSKMVQFESISMKEAERNGEHGIPKSMKKLFDL